MYLSWQFGLSICKMCIAHLFENAFIGMGMLLGFQARKCLQCSWLAPGFQIKGYDLKIYVIAFGKVNLEKYF